jgi:glycosyltransferase involved in cell wall biosynthesis
VRCLLPLIANGWDGDRTTLIAYRKTPENKVAAARASDIVVFHRAEEAMKLELAKNLRVLGKKIVYDNDDTYKEINGFKFTEFMDEERFKRGIKSLNEHTDEFIKFADLVTCSTEFLANEYRQLNDNVAVLPNCIDPFYFDEPLKNDTDVIRIGITGSVGITDDMDVLKPIVEHYQNDPRVRLVLFSMPPDKNDKLVRELYSEEYKFWDSVNVEWQPFVPAEEYYDTLNGLRLDMIIIPRKDTYFNRCKSNLKFLENSMFEIPSICQAFPTGDSPYQQNPKDTEYLLLADTTEEWIEQIEKLINNKDLRREMGRKAKEYVEEEYNIEKHAHKWEDAYKKLLIK